MKPFFDEKLIKDKTLGVAVSGGSDSMALLCYLVANWGEFSFDFVCVTLDHGIRGAAGKNDADFVENFCLTHGVKCIRHKVDSPAFARENKITLEQAARELRYNCFFSDIEKGLYDLVATAHHKGDNAETVLLNILRGSGKGGSSGMEYISHGGRVIRPLLYTDKGEITAFIDKYKLEFVSDGTNKDTAYTRNFLRLEILPRLKEKFPKAEDALVRFAAFQKEDEEYLNAVAGEYLIGKKEGVFIIDCAYKAVFSRAVRQAAKILGVYKDIESVHISALFNLQKNHKGKRLDLPYMLTAVREEEGILLYKKEDGVEFAQIPCEEGEFRCYDKSYRIEECGKGDAGLAGALYADAALLEGAVIRTRKSGDTFKKFAGGTKSLNDYLTDIKIPARNKDKIPVIALDGEILAVLGYEIADKVKVTEKTKKIFKLTVI